MKLFKKAKKGFTLVELVVVIAVIAILAAVSVGAYFGVTESANNSKLEQEAKQVLFERVQEKIAGEIASYIKEIEGSCFVCNRINKTFERYIATIFYLYKTEEDFRNTFRSSKGFCTKHYGMLYLVQMSYRILMM